jgi:hypothetical protein
VHRNKFAHRCDRRFQLRQVQTGVRPLTINSSVAALRFFFTVTLGRADMARHLTFVREPRKIPTVLSEEEIVRLLEAAPGPKYKDCAGCGSQSQLTDTLSLTRPYRRRLVVSNRINNSNTIPFFACMTGYQSFLL